MNIIRCEYPLYYYDLAINNNKLDERIINDIHEILKGFSQLERIIIFGKSITSTLICRELDNMYNIIIVDSSDFLCHIKNNDVVIIATSPFHYKNIINAIKNVVKDITIVLLFQTDESSRIEVIVESQPRSGTHYLINNLQLSLQLHFASVFYDRGLVPSKDKLWFHEKGDYSGFIVKSHFTKPLYYPAYRYIKTIYLLRYFFDSYYSWAKLIYIENNKITNKLNNYFFKIDSLEWQLLEGYIELHKKWLFFIKDKFFIRYEDFYLKFNSIVSKLQSFLQRKINNFEYPDIKLKEGKMYWEDNYLQLMDEKIYLKIKKEFSPFIKMYYPEKISKLF